MSATDELRRLLDERGVAHSDHYLSTTWRDGHGILHLAGEPMADGSLVVDMLTPEQAIAATLGSGTLTAEQVCETVEKHWHDLPAEYDMTEATALPEYSYDWQAIADELNAAWNSRADYHGYEQAAIESWESIKAWNSRAERTCELHDCEGSFSAVNKPVWRCDCGAFMTQYTDATTYHKPRFCPNCGCKVIGG